MVTNKMTTTTDTPRTDACPHCGAKELEGGIMQCHSYAKTHANAGFRSMLCHEREARQKAEAERDEARKDLIKNLQTTGGLPWRKWREECVKETLRADENLERAEKAEAEVERLRALLPHDTTYTRQLENELADADDEIERLKKERYPFQSFEQFCNFLTSNNLIDELAVSNPQGWDGGAELSRISAAFKRATELSNQ